ncbi:hypothetical protein E1176_12680 [Fulvivirga sp. RKSG066]|uniref:hypothetical protein n=1 Tax=Fulvivirga aurantia TaxID=2529383 RepID=UPI0012BC476F|nr:hypothetical protein [Fulvivirga aurantia]MTI21880.1 hypothetical protein [Fulvivirga aurantia]
MAKKDSKKDKESKKPKVNKDLEGFDIEIDSFGEITSSFDIDKINAFLNKNVEDKKLIDREDYDKLKKGKKTGSDEEE